MLRTSATGDGRSAVEPSHAQESCGVEARPLWARQPDPRDPLGLARHVVQVLPDVVAILRVEDNDQPLVEADLAPTQTEHVTSPTRRPSCTPSIDLR